MHNPAFGPMIVLKKNEHYPTKYSHVKDDKIYLLQEFL